MPLGFTYRLELADGTPADKPTVTTQVSNWRVGDVIPCRADRTSASSRRWPASPRTRILCYSSSRRDLAGGIPGPGQSSCGQGLSGCRSQTISPRKNASRSRSASLLFWPSVRLSYVRSLPAASPGGDVIPPPLQVVRVRDDDADKRCWSSRTPISEGAPSGSSGVGRGNSRRPLHQANAVLQS